MYVSFVLLLLFLCSLKDQKAAVQLAMRYLQDGYQWEPVWDRGAGGDLDWSWKRIQKIYKKKHLVLCITGLGQLLL